MKALKFLAPCAMVFLLTGVAHAETQSLPVGGTGGGPFRLVCAPGEILSGFRVKTGSALDSVAIVCSRFRTRSTVGFTTTRGRTGGRGGGVEQFKRCRDATGSAVKSLDVFVDNFLIVNRFAFSCLDLRTSAQSAFRSFNAGGRARYNSTASCQAGHIGIGIHGNSGALIDRLGIVCELPDTVRRAANVR